MTYVVRPTVNGQATGTVESILAELHHTFGDNDLLVARRRMRSASGDALVTWSQIVETLEARRAAG